MASWRDAATIEEQLRSGEATIAEVLVELNQRLDAIILALGGTPPRPELRVVQEAQEA